MSIKVIKLLAVIIIIALSVVLPLTLAPFDKALATADPDSDPSIDNVHCQTYLIEEHDVVIFGEYRLPYTTIPSEPASSTYMITLLDSSGNATGFTVPYAYFDYGYNLGAFAMYFSASDNLTWSGNYTIRVAQSPAYFATPEIYDFPIPAESWTAATTKAINQTELAVAVITTAEHMETEYTDYTLLESGLSGTVLYSPTGENYFRNVLYGIQAMAPDLFLYQIMPYDTTVISYTMNMSDNYTARYDAYPWISDNVTAAGTDLGLTPVAVMALGFSGPVCLTFIIVSAKKFHKVEPGLLVACLIVLVTYMMGWMPAAIFATIYQICGIYLAFIWFYARG